ncbi:guanylate-binding protein 3-like [Brachyhypopomus gauderio]|uniref:guanylate-binding protein 3-like n=1 Tax=Brachyhypopomus gauderio TaxID=698409 RepID=UPI0040410E8E
MKEPLCLIGSDSEEQLCVLKEAKAILEKITQPVVVVSVVGLYRTGKSYLMNRLARKQTGFALGNTIESKTKGIWMWCVPHPTISDHTLVLLDTEGLGDVDKGDEKHDTWIFCLAVLLSSTLVYNSLGVIDNMALEKLHYVSELTENIRVKAHMSRDEDESAEFMRVFPSFIWTVRDFTLILEKDNQPITADQYLESALVLRHGNSDKIERFNLPRRCLRNYFAERKCFVFPRPTSDENLRKIEDVKEEDLDPRFLKQAQEFCSYVFSNAKPKTVTGGRTLTGTVLGSLAEVYVEAIRRGRVPCLENAVKTLAQIQNGKAVEQAVQVYINQMFISLSLPMDPAELSDLHQQAERKAIEVFISTSFNDAEQKAQMDLMGQIQSEYEGLCHQNQEECIRVCKSKLTRVFAPLEEALSEGSFMRPGGYQEYRSTVKRLTQEYRSYTDGQLMNEKVLTEYLNAKEKFAKNILAADQRLTEAEQKTEVERLRMQAVEQRQKGLEKQNGLKEQMLKDQQRTYEQHLNQLMERMEREHKRAQEDNERVMQAKLNEQRVLLEQGFQDKANQMNRQIEGLKNEMRNHDDSKRSTFSKVVENVGTAAALFLPGIIPKAFGAIASFFSSWF